MTPLRVLILRHEQIIDVHSFEDPRQEFVTEFNRLNEETSFWAIVEEQTSPPWKNRMRCNCFPKRRCE